MRWFRLIRVLGVAGLAGGAVAAGCGNDAEDCQLSNSCTTATGTGGNGGDGGSVSPGCVPSTLPSGAVLPDTCAGVYVSGTLGSDTTGDGTRAAPYASLDKALSGPAPAASVIYACSAQTADTATVTLPAGTSLFGGLDCADWHYTGDKTILSPAATIALVLAPGGGARVEDFHIESANATVLGDSSIAVLANATTSASLTRVELVAGDGANGEAGISVPDDPTGLRGVDGNPGNPSAGVCGTDIVQGGTGGPRTCDGTDVSGGKGGNAGLDPGGLGQEGLPQSVGTSGNGGIGQQLGGTPHSCSSSAAQPGADGAPGPDGAGAGGMGALSALGYAGVNGIGGDPGTPGQGGGGGGASACTSGATGPSGGGGGSGGCGGFAGGAGKAAGSSFALAAFDATVAISNASLTTGNGGAGGDGGDGQAGGAGGGQGLQGGFPATTACPGAAGGAGGPGGSGGGGQGGHSAGIASTASATVTLDTVTYSLGTLGPAGLGGDSKPALDGDAGTSSQILVL